MKEPLGHFNVPGKAAAYQIFLFFSSRRDLSRSGREISCFFCCEDDDQQQGSFSKWLLTCSSRMSPDVSAFVREIFLTCFTSDYSVTTVAQSLVDVV